MKVVEVDFGRNKFIDKIRFVNSIPIFFDCCSAVIGLIEFTKVHFKTEWFPPKYEHPVIGNIKFSLNLAESSFTGSGYQAIPRNHGEDYG